MAADGISQELAGLSVQPDSDGGIIAELTSRHANSRQPESQQVLAVLQAVVEVIQSEGMPVTPTTMFAAVMSALEKPESLSSPQVTLAMCTVLSATLSRVPNGILRSKFIGCCLILTQVNERFREQAAVLKAAIACLGSVLAAMEPGNWIPATAAFNLLLSYLTDARPKVRKRAQGSVTEVLAALQNTPALGPASEAITKLCGAVVPGPAAAARAAAAASNKQRATAEEAITKAVSDVLHLLGALKQLLPLMAGASLPPILDQLLKLYPLRQPLLVRHTTEVLTALASAPSSAMTSSQLSQLLGVVLESDEIWDRRNADAVLALTRLVECGMMTLHQKDAGACRQRLPKAFHVLVHQLSAEQDGVRFGTSEALKNLIRTCIDDDMILHSLQPPKGQQLPPVTSIVAAVGSTMTASYQESWNLALPVVGTLLERLGTRGAPLATPLISQLGELCGGAFDAGDNEGQEGVSRVAPVHAHAAEATMGTALRCIGPEAVLAVFPLNLKEGLEGTAEPRTWLLPLMRKHVRGTHISYWTQQLLPLAKLLGSRAAAATAAGQKLMALNCHTLELQIWHTLTAFCTWPRDGVESYPAMAREAAGAFNNREDLRGAVCAALERMCHQCRAVLLASGNTDVLPSGGLPETSSSYPDADSDQDDEDDDTMLAGVSDVGAVPDWFTADVAKANVHVLRQFSKNWLPLMFRVFLATPSESRGHIASVIAAYASISEASLLANLFRAALGKLIKVMNDASAAVPPPDMITEGGSNPTERQASFLELSLCLAGGLDDDALTALFTAAKPYVLGHEALLQKKGYKVIAYLTEKRPSWLQAHLQPVLELLLTATASSMSAAKRFRLRCLRPIILLLQHTDCPPLQLTDDAGRELLPGGSSLQNVKDAHARRQHLASLLVGELVLCTKEPNTKTRTAAYQLLVDVAHELDNARPITATASLSGRTDDSSDMDAQEYGMPRGGHAQSSTASSGLNDFVTCVLGGLVGSSPHMISATVMALARLLYEFAGQLEGLVPQLLPAVLSLMRSNSREVVKAVLGFLKVCAMRMPPDLLIPQLKPMLEGLLLWSEDSKNKFKLKVRMIIERLARRCGHDALAAVMPPSEVKLLAHIRKQHHRKDRRRSNELAAGSQADEGEAAETRSQRSGVSRSSIARTARRSEWGHSKIFSDDASDGGDEGPGGAGAGARSGVGMGRGASTSGRGQSAGGRGGSGAGRLADSAEQPLDLLDVTTARQLVKTAAGKAPKRGGRDMVDDGDDDFGHGDDGRMVINDEEAEYLRKKRKRAAEDYDEDDSDFDDLRSIKGLSVAMRNASKSVRFAPTVAASLGGKSRASNTSARGAGAGVSKRGTVHTGDKYKPKASATGGDVKGKGSVDPYAYWQFDRKMLNRRRGKQASASKGLNAVVAGAKSGALKGGKAKRASNAKRARRS